MAAKSIGIDMEQNYATVALCTSIADIGLPKTTIAEIG